MTEWSIQGREFTNCNCAYGCPCQFNALPTYGDCKAIAAFAIEKGHYGDVSLDGLAFVGRFAWPKAIHEGNGTAQVIVDERADERQREAILRIASGEDTEPGATIFNVFAATFTKVLDPIFAPIDFEVDVDGRTARVDVKGLVESRGEPIRNPVSGNVHRARVNLPHGFEYLTAEYARGWTKTMGDLALEFGDSHGHFVDFHLTPTGPVR